MNLSYRIYGLSLSSDLPIPGLRGVSSASDHPDLHVQFGAEPQWVVDALRLPATVLQRLPACEETQDPAFVLTAFGGTQFFRLDYSDGTRFVVNAAATHIWGAAGPSQTMEDLSTYFLGPVLGFVLRRRGITALHGSSVCVDGRAIILTGEAGAGKSTSAAALALRGLAVLCEDVAAIHEQHGAFFVRPGYPRVCLWPESVAMLLGQPESLPRIAPNWEKCYLPLDDAPARHASCDQPLGAIYILATRDSHAAPRIEEVNGRDILVELVQSTYMNWLLDRQQRAQEFELLSRLASQIPVRRIVPHRDPARIGALCDLLLDDARLTLSGRRSIAAAASV